MLATGNIFQGSEKEPIVLFLLHFIYLRLPHCFACFNFLSLSTTIFALLMHAVVCQRLF